MSNTPLPASALLTMDVLPGRGLGCFELGMSITEAISQLQQRACHIPNVDLLYCDKSPLSYDLVLKLEHQGLQLRFDPVSQRLRLIDVFDMSKLHLSYSGTVFSGPQMQTKFSLIYNLFGPTYPGHYSSKKQAYFLSYPSLSFLFPVPTQHQHIFSSTASPNNTNASQLDLDSIQQRVGSESDSSTTLSSLPVEFPDGSSPLAARLFLYHGSNLKQAIPPPVPSASLYFEEVLVRVGSSLLFSKRKRKLGFFCTPQDVCSDLGKPCKISMKQVDKLRIHSLSSNESNGSGETRSSGSSSASTSSYSGCLDYFFNYFHLGLDILFDGETHQAKKFILHTNSPCHPSFNQYAKCNFRIVPSESLLQHARMAAARHSLSTTSPASLPLNASTPPPNSRHSLSTTSPASLPLNASTPPPNSTSPCPLPSGRVSTLKHEDEFEEISFLNDNSPKLSGIDLHPHSDIRTTVRNISLQSGVASTPSQPKKKSRRPLIGGLGMETGLSFGSDEDSEGSEGENYSPTPMIPAVPPTQLSSPASNPPTPTLIHPDMTWTHIQQLLGPSSRPLVLSEGSTSNPFGATYFYAYENIIFEVMSNDHLASVTLFFDKTPRPTTPDLV